MDEQEDVVNKGGTMRLGQYPCNIKPNTLLHQLYGLESISERHRHRYEFNNAYKSQFESKGMVFSIIKHNTRIMMLMCINLVF